MDIGSKIKTLRKKSGFTQDELAEAIGETKSKVVNWEIGRTTIPANTFLKIIEVLNTDINKFLSPKTTESDNINTFYKVLREIDTFNIFNRFMSLNDKNQRIVNKIIGVLEEEQTLEKEKNYK